MKDSRSHNKAQLALLRLLVKVGLIDGGQSVRELEQGDLGPLGHFASKGLFVEKEALEKIAIHLNLPCIFLEDAKSNNALELLDQKPFHSIPLARWREMRVLPAEFHNGQVVLAMANPLDSETKSSLEFELGVAVTPALVSEVQLLALIERKLNSSPMFDVQSIFRESKAQSSSSSIEDSLSMTGESTVFIADPEAAPVIRLVNKIFSDAIEAGASDIHFTPEKKGVFVRIRVDGILHGLIEVPEQLKNAVVSRVKLLSGMDISERRKPQDGRLRLNSARGYKDLRISSVPTAFGENIVIRVLSSDLQHTTFESLGMLPELHAQFTQWLKGSSRVLLVSGPTGSGKSSTLYAALNSLADGTQNIITVEDPVEYRIPGITQIQVNQKTGVTFAEGLRSILRQDPDVIMVGEIRDKETASIAMQAAQTGHLVLSTIHTNSAISTVTRLLDLGLQQYLLASSIGGVVAQRLVRKLCQDCCKPAEPEYLKNFENLQILDGTLRQAAGCPSCKGSGYRGRIGVFSLLEFNDDVRDAVREGLGEKEIESRARRNGYRSLEEAGFELAKNGLTTLDELERILGALKASNPVHVAGSVKSGLAAAAGLSRRRILLVEDDEDTRSVLSLLLRGELFDVAEASNGYEALDQIYQQVPELILCDLMMPKMDGAQMVERLRKDARTRSIPVIMLTAADSEDNEIRSIGNGADDFISKTTDAKVMLARIHRLLDRATS